MYHMNQEPLDFAASVTLLRKARKDLAEALALLRELNDALVIPGWLQPRVDVVLDRAEEKIGALDSPFPIASPDEEVDTLRKIRTGFATMPAETIYTREQILSIFDVVSQQLSQSKRSA